MSGVPATGTSQVRTDQLQSFVQQVYLPAGLDVLFDEAEALRDSLVVLEKSMDRLNRVWEIYNKKGGLNVAEDPNLDVGDIDDQGFPVSTPDDAIVIDVDIETLDTGETEDFNPNVILLSHASSADFETLKQLQGEMETLIDKLTEANGGVPPPLAEQMEIVVAGINEIDDTDEIVYWHNDYLPDTDISLEELAFTDDAETIPYGNQIRDAVSSSQASNEEARQQLRQSLFTWEEFVKSAGSVIERITRMIEGFARGIKGQ
jgi:hypothetical protein